MQPASDTVTRRLSADVIIGKSHFKPKRNALCILNFFKNNMQYIVFFPNGQIAPNIGEYIK